MPAAQGLVVLSFATIPAALDRLAEIVETGPVAVEMLDRMILDLAAQNPLFARHLNFTEGMPAAVLAAQFYADSARELADRARDLAGRFEGRPGVLGVRTSLTDAEKDDFWKIRKAGFSLLMGMVGDAKPIAFVEDTAVDPARLPEFYDRFRAIVARRGVAAACYGHADVGCLHIRPVINVKTWDGVETLRSIAREVSDLVVEFGGSMSGEHGDGLARTLWNRKLFGPEVYAAFEAVKCAFDPEDLLNPGKVVGDADPGDNLRIGPAYHPREPDPTVLDFSGQGGFAGAVEMCSGVGACRKSTGTMCPSYMVTRDEMHTTRGRANLLRLAMTGELPGRDGGLDNESLHEALDLCLQCKACKTECPSKVDMAKLKAEVLHRRYQGGLRPIGHLLLGQIFRLNPIASATAPLANAMLSNPAFKWLLEKVAGIDRRRTLPTFARNHLRRWFRGHRVGRPRPASAGESSCWMTASRRITIPRSGLPPSGCWRRPATGSSWPGCRAAAGRRSPRGSCLRPASSPPPMWGSSCRPRERASRSWAASRAAWSRSSMSTATSAWDRMPRTSPRPRSSSTRSSPIRYACPTCRSSRARAACCCTAIASRRRCSARRARWPRCGGFRASTSASWTRGAAAWPARSATSAATTR